MTPEERRQAARRYIVTLSQMLDPIYSVAASKEISLVEKKV
jgi:hypothetical protein